jgi:hypothetical protein
MSGNTFTCRDRYFNYGSYLRSRGYDKEICNLITAIEQGQIPIGPIYPGNCSKRINTVIKGNVDIVPCEATDNKPTPISGQLSVQGGYIGVGGIDVSNGINIPSQVALQAQGYGIQSLTGISSYGPIYQQTDCSHSNWFGAKDHVFTGVPGGDCSSNVFIRGNLYVDGDTFDLKGFIGETLSLVTLDGNGALGTLNTFKSPLSNGNMVDMYAARLLDVASVPLGADQWKNFLAFAIDGNSDHPQTDVSGIDASGGMSNVMGHMRGFRGLTITNPPSSGPVDIQWNPDISGTSRAIDAYGSIRVQPGNTGAPGNIDISGGQFRIFQNDISNVVLFSNGDASFNGRVSCYDLSVTNIATFGASTTYIDTSNVNTSYVTVDNSLNTKFIYAPNNEDLYINAFDGVGSYSDIYMTALDIFMDADLSVNDVSSSNINNTGLIVTHDLSVNSHASIYDLSVGIITIVDGEFTDISVNNHASIYDLSVTNFLVVDGDISANNIRAANFILNVGNGNLIDLSSNVTILDISFTDLSNNVTVLDISFTDLSNNVTVLESSFTDLSNNVTVLESSFTDLSNNVTVLDISFTDLSNNVTVLDTSVNLLESSVTVLDISFTDLSNNVTVLESSFTDLSNNVTVLESSFTDLSNNVTVLDISFTDLSNNVTVLDTSVNLLESSVTVLDISFTDLSNNVTVLDISFTDLSNNVTVLDASMAFVEQTGFVRMRKTNTQDISNTTSTWTEIDLNQADYTIGNIYHSGSTEFKIGQKGLYSYNIQLSLKASTPSFTVDNLELALTNGGPTPGAFLNPSDINDSGSNSNGGFNKEFSEHYRAFIAGEKCFISGNGVGLFEAGDLLRIYLRWSSSTVGSHKFDINDPSGTIVTFALIQALE